MKRLPSGALTAGVIGLCFGIVVWLMSNSFFGIAAALGVLLLAQFAHLALERTSGHHAPSDGPISAAPSDPITQLLAGVSRHPWKTAFLTSSLLCGLYVVGVNQTVATLEDDLRMSRDELTVTLDRLEATEKERDSLRATTDAFKDVIQSERARRETEAKAAAEQSARLKEEQAKAAKEALEAEEARWATIDGHPDVPVLKAARLVKHKPARPADGIDETFEFSIPEPLVTFEPKYRERLRQFGWGPSMNLEGKPVFWDKGEFSVMVSITENGSAASRLFIMYGLK